MRLGILYIYLTKGCNMSCKHCWIEASKPMASELPVGYFKKAIYEASKLGLTSVKITGGEPFLRKSDMFELITTCKRYSIKNVTIETNGTLMREEDVVLLKSMGLTEIAISLDFSNEELFDDFRGLKGAFQGAVKAMKLCVKHKIPTQCLMTVVRSNLNDMRKVAKIVLEDIGVDILKASSCVSIGRAKDYEELLSPEDFLVFRKLLYKLADKYPNRIYSFLPWALTRLKYLRVTRASCGFKNLLSILPNGNVTLCGIGFTHPEVVFGNIASSSIEEIWNSQHPLLLEIRSLSADKVDGVCSKCIFRKRCFNPCLAHTYEAYGKFNAPYPICQELFEKGLFPKEFLI